MMVMIYSEYIVIQSLTNKDLISAEFSLELNNCGDYESDSHVTILDPMDSTYVIFHLEHSLIRENTICQILLMDHRDVVVAERDIVIQTDGHCYCISYCQCQCGVDIGGNCTMLSQIDYSRAGYRDPLPQPVRHLIHEFIHMGGDDGESLAIFLTVLLLMGVCKMLIGAMWLPRIGSAGLCLFKKSNLTSYYESDLHGCEVVHDSNGMPINPQSGEPARLTSYTE